MTSITESLRCGANQCTGTLVAPLSAARVAPVLTIDDVHSDVPIGQASVTGGTDLAEGTLRTRAALDCIAALRAILELTVGAGTGSRPAATEKRSRGWSTAQSVVSAGVTKRLLAGCEQLGEDVLPRSPRHPISRLRIRCG